VRAGLKVPGPLKGLGIPPTTPRNAGLALGLLLTLGVALFFLHDHLQEAALKRAVLSAKAAAMNPVSRQVQIEVLTETPEAVRKEAQDALSSDPLLCYFRIQECLRADPVDPGAAQLLEQAKTRLGESRPSGDLGSFQKSLQAGDLESAETCILGLLRQAPDTDDLKEKARTVSLLLAQYFAAKDRFSHARERLLLVRAMYPQEKIWQAKIRLLEAIQNLPRADRAGWIPMLG
jgi:predicted Zn-dependent protease